MSARGDARSCPRCFAGLSPDAAHACAGCGLAFERTGGVIDVIGPGPRGAEAERVEAFYAQSPFPGYAAGDDGAALLDRSRRSPFLAALDAAVAPGARILDCGCGTAQLAAFLALAGLRRKVLGVDGCRAALLQADEFRRRAGVANLQLVRADLFDMPLPDAAFDVVVARGVVHHTPDPDAAIGHVARRVAHGGVLVLGFYEPRARLAHRLRRGVARLRGRPVATLDPILRRRDLDPEKRRIWIDDQYHHPLEHLLALQRVLARLEALGFRWVRSVPPAPSGDLFDATPEPRGLQLGALRLGWALRGCTDPDAGLVVLIARRHCAS
jgi:SAM-dependent methyltransferase